MNTFPTLLKREFWEHKGGMLWAPAVVGGLMALVAVASLVIGLSVAGSDVQINGQQIIADGTVIASQTQDQMARGLALAIVPSMAPLAGVLAFVVLFYALGSLYDDRRDRSILFWKSMPVSDTATVLSKLVSMALIAPLLTAIIGSIVGILVALLVASSMSAFGGEVLSQLLVQKDFYLAPLAIFAVIPVYALWAVPGIAWCMLVSAWAKRTPFLWAVGVPVVAGALLSWQQAMFDRRLGAEWFWEHVVGRLFGGFVPGMWFVFADQGKAINDFKPENESIFSLVGQSYMTLSSPSLWIGLLVGTALLVAAVRLRRWREDAA